MLADVSTSCDTLEFTGGNEQLTGETNERSIQLLSANDSTHTNRISYRLEWRRGDIWLHIVYPLTDNKSRENTHTSIGYSRIKLSIALWFECGRVDRWTRATPSLRRARVSIRQSQHYFPFFHILQCYPYAICVTRREANKGERNN